MDHCQHVTRKSMAASASKNQRRSKRQIAKHSNTCLWNVRESQNWRTNQISVPQVADQLRALAELAHRLFAEQDYRGSLRQPLQPPHCNGKRRGVHSDLRSSVEQQRFAHTVSLLGALPSSLSDVGRKNKVQADDAHNTSTDTPGWIMASYAYGGRALELQILRLGETSGEVRNNRKRYRKKKSEKQTYSEEEWTRWRSSPSTSWSWSDWRWHGWCSSNQPLFKSLTFLTLNQNGEVLLRFQRPANKALWKELYRTPKNTHTVHSTTKFFPPRKNMICQGSFFL